MTNLLMKFLNGHFHSRVNNITILNYIYILTYQNEYSNNLYIIHFIHTFKLPLFQIAFAIRNT